MKVYQGHTHYIVCLYGAADDINRIRRYLDVDVLIAELLQYLFEPTTFFFFHGNDLFLDIIVFDDRGGVFGIAEIFDIGG